MALTAYQITILKLLSDRRRKDGESYIAGGVALNAALNAPRLSHDIDIFHDTAQALASTWLADSSCLEKNGYSIQIVRENPSYIEATIHQNSNITLIQWVRDSAFRFFPLIEDDVFGLTLHPFDLATNKILALAGRLEPRDWVDVIECHRSLQPLGYLLWAACGKDPGINPEMVLSDASRLHYSNEEIDTLVFENNRPHCAQLSQEWKCAISSGREIVEILPEEHIGKCILNTDGTFFSESSSRFLSRLESNTILFHEGAIGGTWPQIVN